MAGENQRHHTGQRRRHRGVVHQRDVGRLAALLDGLAEPFAGLQQRASAKLAEVEARIADLQAIAATLRATVAAGCDDLVTCAGEPCCPIPFATIAQGPPDATPNDAARR